jgi:hypothetical protein
VERRGGRVPHWSAFPSRICIYFFRRSPANCSLLKRETGLSVRRRAASSHLRHTHIEKECLPQSSSGTPQDSLTGVKFG